MSMGMSMVAALHPKGRLHPEDRDLAGRRLRKADQDPLFERKVIKAIAALRCLPSARHHQLAAALRDALDFAEATGCNLPELLDQRALLARLIG